jgi:Mn-containing catalase
MLLDIGTEELAHVEMITTMIDRLLDAAPLKEDEATSDGLKATWAHSQPQHTIVNGGGGYPADSNGVPWSGAFITASGNLLADFHLNATAEMQGRLQVARLWNMTDDPGVKDLLRFLITRDHMHQLQWLAAIEEIKADGLDAIPVPEAFDRDEELDEFAYTYIKASDGPNATDGRWASGPAPDGHGEFSTAVISAHGDRPTLPPGDPRLYGMPPATAEGVVGKVKDLLT